MREIADVGAFLAREPRASQVGLAQGCDPLGCDDPGQPLEPQVCRAASRKGDLLLEDYLDESLKASRAVPQRRWAVPCDDPSEVRVAPRQFGDALGERADVQLKGHVDLTRRAIAV